MTTPRRYVRVARVQRGIAGGRTRPWWRWDCICGVWGGKYDLADSHANATKHSGKCRTLRLATERDQLAREVQRLEADLATAYSDHMHDLVRLTAHAGRTEIERDQLAAELDRMRADRDRLHQINPLSKDNDR